MRRFVTALFFVFALAPRAIAGELTVIGQATSIAALHAIVPQFEKHSGDTVHLALGNPAVTRDRLSKNATVDVVVLGTGLWNDAIKAGRVDEASRVTIGETHIGIGVSVKARKPVIRDAASLTAFLRKVKTIGLVDPNGGSGTSPPFMKAMEALGIAAEIAPKYRYIAGAGDAVSDAIAKGDVECGVTAIPELGANKGVRVIGPIPAQVLDWSATTYAAVGSHAQNPDAARKFVAFLQTPAARRAFAAIGFSPAH
jgi:ABC-type molybdate transport system substrate-binding protein